MTWAILVNPHSGRRQGLTFAHNFQAEANLRGRETLWICGSTAEQSREQLRDAISIAELSAVVVVGGDGLVNLAIQELAGSQIPMAVLAAGTGNDFARANRTFGLSPAQLAELMSVQLPVSIDLGKVKNAAQDKWFGQILSTGFDSVVNDRANTYRRLRGKMKYNIATVMELPKFSPMEYRIELDDRVLSTKAMLVAIANGPTYGGGMKVCPDANRHDGLFDILILSPLPKWEFMAVFPKVFKGTHITHPKVEIVRSKKVHISADAKVFADGENLGQLPVHIETIPSALRTWIAP